MVFIGVRASALKDPIALHLGHTTRIPINITPIMLARERNDTKETTLINALSPVTINQNKLPSELGRNA